MDLAQYSYVRMKSKVSAETVDLNLSENKTNTG